MDILFGLSLLAAYAVYLLVAIFLTIFITEVLFGKFIGEKSYDYYKEMLKKKEK